MSSTKILTRAEKIESLGLRPDHATYIPGLNLVLHHPLTGGYQVFKTDEELTFVTELFFSGTLPDAVDFIHDYE